MLVHQSNELEPTKTQHTRSWSFLGTRERGVLVLTRNGSPTSYDVLQTGDDRWELLKDGVDEVYSVFCTEAGIRCGCLGWKYRAKCVHSDAMMELIVSDEFQPNEEAYSVEG